MIIDNKQIILFLKSFNDLIVNIYIYIIYFKDSKQIIIIYIPFNLYICSYVQIILPLVVGYCGDIS